MREDRKYHQLDRKDEYWRGEGFDRLEVRRGMSHMLLVSFDFYVVAIRLTPISCRLVVIESSIAVLLISEITRDVQQWLTSCTLIPAQCLYPRAISAGLCPCSAAKV